MLSPITSPVESPRDHADLPGPPQASRLQNGSRLGSAGTVESAPRIDEPAPVEEILRNYNNLYNRHHPHEQLRTGSGYVYGSGAAAGYGIATAAEVAAVAAAFGDHEDAAADTCAQSPPRRSDRLRSPRYGLRQGRKVVWSQTPELSVVI